MMDTFGQAQTAKRVRVMIVDDHELIRYGVSQLIDTEKDLEVCGEAPDAATAIDVVRRSKPEIAIVDLSLGNGDGMDLIRRIKAEQPTIRIVVLSMHDERLHAERVLRAGAHAYVNKEKPADELLTAIRRVQAGHIFLSEAMTDRLLGMAVNPEREAESPVESLSDREFQIFQMIGRGQSVKNISQELHISPKTVEYHRAHAKEKLHLRTASELVHYAIEWTMKNA